MLRLPAFIYKHLHFKGRFRVRINEGSFFINHYGYCLENDLFWRGLNREQRVWARLSRRAKVILDIGANTGIFSLIAKAVNPQAKIYAFEPIPRIADRFRQNCELNKFDIPCFEVAVSSLDGKGIIYDKLTENPYSSTVGWDAFPSAPSAVKEIELKKLSTFIKENNLKVDLMKIDVDAHEFEVLQGMGEYLHSMKPAMIIEILRNKETIERLLKGAHWEQIDKFNYLIEWQENR